MGRHRRLPTEPVLTTVHNLTHEGHGVAKVNGKTVFIPGSLPGEEVQFIYTERKRNYDTGKLLEIRVPSSHRVTPRCQHAEICGGCSLQHLEAGQQLEFKQKLLLDNLTRIGHVTPQAVLPPVTGSPWGYRRKARLGVKYVIKKERLIAGFREKASHYLADIRQCETLDERLGHRLDELTSLLRQLACYQQIPQVEVAIGDEVIALVIRHMVPLTATDIELLTKAAQHHGWHIYQQPGGLDSIKPLWPVSSELTYRVDADTIELAFNPTDFIQVNRTVNLAMIQAALTALQLDNTMRVLELFSGLGNFTLPLARRAAQVVAVEGETGLVKRARENAQRNRLENVQHYIADLAEDVSRLPWLQLHYDRVLLDPPRSGAINLIPLLAAKHPQRMVYISCNPATLARDADLLVNQHGYRLTQVGVLDMFPHTAHVEAMAVFERG